MEWNEIKVFKKENGRFYWLNSMYCYSVNGKGIYVFFLGKVY